MTLVRVQVRRDTAANWTSANPVLFIGEPGLETDTGKVKYGDGVRNWVTLPYSSGVTLGSSAPPDIGTAAAGASSLAARADHSHATPPNLAVQSLTATGNASVGGSLTVSGPLVGGAHRHSTAEINNFADAVFAQISASIKAGSNVTASIDNATKTITINSTAAGTTPLMISAHPGDATSLNGSATFTSQAIGGSSELAYQWQSSSDNGTSWLDVAGATGTALALSGLSGADDGRKYRLKAMSGTEVVYSLPATLRLPSIVITGQPPDITVTVGQLVTLAVSATAGSAAVAYQWESRADSSSEWVLVPGASQATYSFSPASASAGRQYRAAVSALGLVLYSRTADVVVNAPSVIFSSQPSDAVSSGGTAQFAGLAIGGTEPLTYRWQKASATGDFADIADGASGASGQATTLLSLTGLVAADHLARYRLRATDAAGLVALSAPATVQTLTLLITAQPADVSSTNGATLASTAFSVTGTAGGTITYQWQKSTDAGATWANISGATSATYGSITVNYIGGTFNDGNLFRCGLTFSGQTIYSRAAALSVSPTALTISAHPEDATSNNGSASFSVTYSGGPSGDATVTWQWRPVGSGADGWRTVAGSVTTSSSTTRTYSFSGLVSNVVGYRVRAMVAKGAATVFSNAVTLTIPGIDALSSLLPTDVVSTNGTATFTASFVLTSCSSSASVQWQQSTDVGVTWSNISGATSNTLSLTGLTSGSNNYKYRAVITACNVTAYTREAFLTVASPPLVITTQPLNVTTSGTSATFTFAYSGGDGGTAVIKWERQVPGLAGTTWTTVVGATTTSLVVSGITSQLSGTQYRATVTMGALTVTTRSAVLTTSGATITLNPADALAVNGAASFSFDFSGTGCPSPSISWEARSPANTAWGPVAGATGKLLSLVGLTATSSGWLYRAAVRCGDLILYTSEATLTVPSYEFFTSHPASQSVVSGASVTFAYQGAFSAALYPARWQMRRVGSAGWSYYTADGQSEQSISFTAVAAQHHNTEWRVEVSISNSTQSEKLYSNIALLTVNKATSIKTVTGAEFRPLIGIAYGRGAYVALSSSQTGGASRSVDGGDTWKVSFLPASRYWDGIVSTSQGVLVAYSSGDSGTYRKRSQNSGTHPNITTTYSWEIAQPASTAMIARSLDGGVTWSTAVPPFFMGSRVRMWSFPWNNVLIATYRDYTSTSLPTMTSTVFSQANAEMPNTRLGRHYIAFNYNNGAADSWVRYELPQFAGGGPSITSAIKDDACPDISSIAVSPAGLLVCTSRYVGITRSGPFYTSYDRKGYLLYRDLGTEGLGAPRPADQATSGVSTGGSLRTIQKTESVAEWQDGGSAPGVGVDIDYRSGWRSGGKYVAGSSGTSITNHECNSVAYVPNVGFVACHDAQTVQCISQDGKIWAARATERVLGELPLFVNGGDVWGVDTRVPSQEKLVTADVASYPDFVNESLGVTSLTDAVNCWASSGTEILLLESAGRLTYIPIAAVANPAPTGTPSAPLNVGALAKSQRCVVSFSAPSSAGSSAITSYSVQYSSNNGATWTTATSFGAGSTDFSKVVTSLVNGVTYVFRVAAVNASGEGTWSQVTIPVTPSIQPAAAPYGLTATPTNYFVSPGSSGGGYNTAYALSWSAPTSNGGGAITGYRIENMVGSTAYLVGTTTTPSTNAVIGIGLPSTFTLAMRVGFFYSFRVSAITAAGVGEPSAPSAAVQLK